jgi:hypothetical protein
MLTEEKIMGKSQGTIDIDLTAVWKYSSFPGFLVGKATEMTRDGRVYVPAYQSNFKPILLLPPDQYDHINSQLKKLEDIRNKKEKEIKQEIAALLHSSIPKAIVEAFKL